MRLVQRLGFPLLIWATLLNGYFYYDTHRRMVKLRAAQDELMESDARLKKSNAALQNSCREAQDIIREYLHWSNTHRSAK